MFQTSNVLISNQSFLSTKGVILSSIIWDVQHFIVLSGCIYYYFYNLKVDILLNNAGLATKNHPHDPPQDLDTLEMMQV